MDAHFVLLPILRFGNGAIRQPGADKQRTSCCDGLDSPVSVRRALFFWALAAGSAAFVAGAMLLTYVRLSSVQRIAPTRTGIVLPTGRWYHLDEALVAFKDIDAVHVLEHRGNKFAYIDTAGLRYTILSSSLAKRDFDEIMFVLEANTAARLRRTNSG
jgi:hypothetical protein